MVYKIHKKVARIEELSYKTEKMQIYQNIIKIFLIINFKFKTIYLIHNKIINNI
jgi:hypothetical protein